MQDAEEQIPANGGTSTSVGVVWFYCETQDQLYTLYRVLKGSQELARPVPHVFCGPRQGHVPHGALWKGSMGVCSWLHLNRVHLVSVQAEQEFGIAGIKSDLSLVHNSVWQGCPLSLVLLIPSMDRISRCHEGLEEVWVGEQRITPLLFADLVLLVHSCQNL